MRTFLGYLLNKWVIILVILLLLSGYLTVQFKVDWSGIGAALGEVIRQGVAHIPAVLDAIGKAINFVLSPQGQWALIGLVWLILFGLVRWYEDQPDEGRPKPRLKIWIARIAGLLIGIAFAAWISPWFASTFQQVLNVVIPFSIALVEYVRRNAWAMGVVVGLIIGVVGVLLLRAAGAKIPLVTGAVIIAVLAAVGGPVGIALARIGQETPGVIYGWGQAADP